MAAMNDDEKTFTRGRYGLDYSNHAKTANTATS